MKKINILASLLIGGLMLTACDSDRDDNPVMTIPQTFQLNAPADAQNNTLDLVNYGSNGTLTFTANQPDYGGFPLATTYTLQISLDSTFVEADEAAGTQANYVSLPTPYTSAQMPLKGSELNENLISLYETVNGTDSYDNQVRPVYVRCKANVSSVEGSDVYSNTVVLPNVLATYVAPDVTLPTQMFLCGACIGQSWSTWQPMQPVYDSAGPNGRFYTLIYVAAGTGFKWGLKEQDWHGCSEITEIDDQANATVSADGDDNISFANGGWYTIYFTTRIRNNQVEYTLHVGPGSINVIGNSIGSWNGVPMTAPADQTGEWSFNGFTASGELRAYIAVPGVDWWRTEFTIQKSTGLLYYRDGDVANGWAADGKDADGNLLGDDYSVTVGPGNTLYVSVDKGTGRVE